MCCGNTRQNMSGTTIRTRSTQGLGMRPQATNSRPAPIAPRSGAANPMRTVRFEYKGPSGINVFSPVTGRRYLRMAEAWLRNEMNIRLVPLDS